MGCVHCSGGNVNINSTAFVRNVNCPFKEEQLQYWQRLLICVKQQDLTAELGTDIVTVNSALGIIISAISNKKDVCYFEKQLTQILPLIQQVINSNKCQ